MRGILLGGGPGRARRAAGGRGLNIAHEAVDRHAAGPGRNHLALRWLGKRGEVRDFTYAELRDLTNRFANVLRAMGVGPGDRVYVLAGRIPELYVAALGTLKNRSVFCPLFSAFGPEPIARPDGDSAKRRVLVTTESLYRRKVAALRRLAAASASTYCSWATTGPARTVSGTHDYRAR